MAKRKTLDEHFTEQTERAIAEGQSLRALARAAQIPPSCLIKYMNRSRGITLANASAVADQLPGFMGVEHLNDEASVLDRMGAVIDRSEFLYFAGGRETFIPEHMLRHIEDKVVNGTSYKLLLLDDSPLLHAHAKEVEFNGASVYSAEKNSYPSILISDSGFLQFMPNGTDERPVSAMVHSSHAVPAYRDNFDSFIEGQLAESVDYSSGLRRG